jgi:hypothetical protein
VEDLRRRLAEGEMADRRMEPAVEMVAVVMEEVAVVGAKPKCS